VTVRPLMRRFVKRVLTKLIYFKMPRD